MCRVTRARRARADRRPTAIAPDRGGCAAALWPNGRLRHVLFIFHPSSATDCQGGAASRAGRRYNFWSAGRRAGSPPRLFSFFLTVLARPPFFINFLGFALAPPIRPGCACLAWELARGRDCWRSARRARPICDRVIMSLMRANAISEMKVTYGRTLASEVWLERRSRAPICFL